MSNKAMSVFRRKQNKIVKVQLPSLFASGLQIGDIDADINIIIGKGSQKTIQLFLSGSNELVDDVGFVLGSKGVLIDRDYWSRTPFDQKNRNRDQRLKICARAPQNTELFLQRIRGKCSVFGTAKGCFSAIVADGELQVQEVTCAHLYTEDRGTIVVKKITKFLSAQVTGNGKIIVQSGKVESLLATVVGSGSLEFRGNAFEGHLDVIGSGSIIVDSISPRYPYAKVKGLGRIEVKNLENLVLGGEVIKI